MSRTAWFNPCAGIAGDMALAGLVAAGADLDRVRDILSGLPVDGWSITAADVLRSGVAALHLDVQVAADVPERTAADVLALLEAAAVPERVRARSRAVFEALAIAEGRVHGCAPGDVHFHEVGGIDAIVDVVGVCAALEVLCVDDVHAGPVALGVGTITSLHGTLPNPGPAVVELLQAAGAPIAAPRPGQLPITMEITTPTGAALLAGLVTTWGGVPAGTISAIGYGAGTADPPGRANVLQVVLCDGDDRGELARSEHPERLVELATNVDDVTGEVLAYAIGRALAAGALDAWVTPIVMKKGRPAHIVHALCREDTVAAVAATIRAETGSLGVRAHPVDRWPSPRAAGTVLVDGHAIAVKHTSGRAKVEHDDAVAVAAATGRPLRDVLRDAEAAALAQPAEAAAAAALAQPADITNERADG